jgi:threonyl-tRNA synthetase
MLSAHSLATRQEAEEEAPVVLPTNENSPELVKLRHTTAHVMAMAVQRLFPKAQVTIGPWIENGFYYDFDMQGEELLDKDLKAIKKEMIKIINKGFELRREVVPRDEARKRINELGEPYKLELLDAIPEVRLKRPRFTEVD